MSRTNETTGGPLSAKLSNFASDVLNDIYDASSIRLGKGYLLLRFLAIVGRLRSKNHNFKFCS